MNKDIFRYKINHLLDTDPTNIDALLELRDKYADYLYAEKSIIHKATIIDIWKDGVYTDIRDALIKAKNNILCIYVDNTNKYMTFDTVENYALFLNACYLFTNEKMQDHLSNAEPEKLSHYQIVLANKKQKIILSYHGLINDEISNRIKLHIKECFNVDSNIIYNNQWGCHQITINMIIDNFQTNDKYYYQLCEYMHNKGDINHENIKLPPIKKNYDLAISYILAVVFQNIPDPKVIIENLIALVKMRDGDPFMMQNVPNNELDITKKWIANNLPNNREKTMDYYKRYKTIMDTQKNKVYSMNIIGDIIKKYGYGKIRPQNEHVWVKLDSDKDMINILSQQSRICDDQLIIEQENKYEFIYFIIELPYNNNVKIGKTKNVKDRIKSLQTGNPNRLCVYYEIYVPISINLEALLHKKYADKRIGGEWFDFTIDKLNDEIKILQDTYNISQKI
jgi:hypothetical protein